MKNSMVPLQWLNSLEDSTVGDHFQSLLKQRKINQQSVFRMSISYTRFVEYCGGAGACGFGPRLLSRADSSNRIAARRDIDANQENGNHIERYPVGVKVEGQEQHEQQADKGEDRSK